MSTVRNIERRIMIRRESDHRPPEEAVHQLDIVRGMEWSGVWTGYAVFAGACVLLLFLVLGIGFSSINPLDATSWKSAAGGAAVWGAIVFLIATFLGGWAAGASRPATHRHGIMRGISMWGLIMLTLVLAGAWATSNAVAVASSGASTAISSAVPAATQVGTSDLQASLQADGANVSRAQAADIGTHLAARDRAGAAATLARDAGISTAQANDILNRVNAPAQQAGTALKGAGERIAQGAKKAGSKVSWGGFWIALISLGCAILGGAVGSGGIRRPMRAA